MMLNVGLCMQEAWGQTSDPVGWGSQWIKDHQTSGAAANKPVIMEEFGVTSNQSSTYTTWYSTIVSSGLTGDLIWYVPFSDPPRRAQLLTLHAGKRVPTSRLATRLTMASPYVPVVHVLANDTESSSRSTPTTRYTPS